MNLLNAIGNTLENIFGLEGKEEIKDEQPFPGRVSWDPARVRRGDTVKINYQGLLKDSGANEVYLHYGVDNWHKTNTVQMNRTEDGSFEAEIKADGNHELNLCFKDSAGNWDNNNGSNWTIFM